MNFKPIYKGSYVKNIFTNELGIILESNMGSDDVLVYFYDNNKPVWLKYYWLKE
jgi:hypothetical protein